MNAHVSRSALGLFALAVALALPLGVLAADQRTFASPEEAEKALVDAAKAKDRAALDDIFGPDARDLVSGDPVQDANDFGGFAKSCAELATLVPADDGKVVLYIGKENWPFPIPIVKGADGRWRFDTAAGKEEILNRQVGENEIGAIRVCREYARAQREYASRDRDGDEVLEYAQHIMSTAGQKDGLYWPAAEGEELSPYGPLIAERRAEGYGPRPAQTEAAAATPAAPTETAAPKEPRKRRPYHGYFFRILKRQGPDAPGGAYDYVINGNMIGGFAMVAYPAIWGRAGIMTFMVNQQGKVYQKNLGEQTADVAAALTEYNPDKTWTLVKD